MTNKYRSKFEEQWHNRNPNMEYETQKFDYVIKHRYTCDFYDVETDTHFETKGLWDAEDRKKILAVIKQHPGIKIVMVFMNPNNKIRKGSKTTYSAWCDKHKIPWMDGRTIK